MVTHSKIVDPLYILHENMQQLPHVPNEYNLDSVNIFLTTSFFVTTDDEMNF
jgi:hypothetical protein